MQEMTFIEPGSPNLEIRATRECTGPWEIKVRVAAYMESAYYPENHWSEREPMTSPEIEEKIRTQSWRIPR